jgi:hypothetical protein
MILALSKFAHATQPPPLGGPTVQKRIFNGDAKTPLEPLCLTPDQLKERLIRSDALQELILEHNRDHLISGKTYNAQGYVLQLFEYLDRKCTVGEMVAASEGGLSERSISSAVTKLNGILYALLGMRITFDKAEGILRLVNESDVLIVTEKLEKRISKIGKEWAQVSSAYEAQGGDLQQVLAGAGSQTLADLGRLLAPAPRADENAA